jgi:hypothetical protein
MKLGVINMKENLYKWLNTQIRDKENFENDYEQGLHDAYEELGDRIQLGTFDTIVYIKLKSEYNIEGLKHNTEYEAYSVFGGEYFKMINDDIRDFQYYERHKFEVIKVYDYYKKKFIDKNYIDTLNEELKKGTD